MIPRALPPDPLCEELSTTKAFGCAAKHYFSRVKPLKFERPAPKANEVEIHVLYFGVCHSDIHQVENDWGNTVYPCMPGHEIVGRVPAFASPATSTERLAT